MTNSESELSKQYTVILFEWNIQYWYKLCLRQIFIKILNKRGVHLNATSVSRPHPHILSWILAVGLLNFSWYLIVDGRLYSILYSIVPSFFGIVRGRNSRISFQW